MIIDAHMHMWNRLMLPDLAIQTYLEPLRRFNEEYGDLFGVGLDDEIPFGDYDEKIEIVIESMDMNHVDYGIVLGTDFELVGGNRMTNEEYMEWLFQRCSVDDRFMPFISVDPNRRDAIEMMEGLVKRHDPRGIKMYPATGFYPNDERMDAYWDAVDDLGLVVVSHAGMALPPLDEKYCHPSYFARVAENHPDMKIVIAHLGGKFHQEIFPLMDEHPNVFTDCSALQGWMPSDNDVVVDRLRTVVGRFPDRVVFGTDFPLYDEHIPTSIFLRLIRESDWGTEKMKDDLLGNNMARVLGL